MDDSHPNGSLHVSESPAISGEPADISQAAKAETEVQREAEPQPVKAAAEPALETAPRSIIPWLAPSDTRTEDAAAGSGTRKRFDYLAVAATLAACALVAVGGLAAADHVRQSAAVAQKSSENDALLANFATLKSRLDSLEFARTKDEMAEIRKVAAEVKAAAASTHDVGVTLAQVNGRIDRIEKDAGAKIDKLSEKVDHDSAARFADIASRLDRLEKKSQAPAVASAAPIPLPTPGRPPVFPSVSNDTTGSIDRTKSVLRGYTLEDIEGNRAVIDGRDGPMTVGVGDSIPGAGRVLKFERHGRDWALITTQGQIVSEPGAY